MTGERQADLAVVGGGIVGLAHALAAARTGRRVVLFERDEHAVGASIRNFGLLWPIGQPAPTYDRAMRSREIWLDLLKRGGAWYAESGSLHLAHHADEQAVLEEYVATAAHAVENGVRMLTAAEVLERSDTVRPDNLRGALWSPTEINVDPRQAIPTVARVLAEDFGVEMVFGAAVREINLPTVRTTAGDWRVEQVVVCSGNEFQQLYPDEFDAAGIRRCKLQMMRTVPQPGGWALGPTLCAGLTLLHYRSFSHCADLPALRARFEAELPEYLAAGIHVLVSQTMSGEVTLGDSHEYGLTHNPFQHDRIDDAVFEYFSRFAALPRMEIAERWHGIYPSLPDGATELVVRPEPNVLIVNGLGGAGMTMSFGLAEEVIAAW
ncbi:FAD dependent oxidoreductase TIGR03364 [Actinokineospora alba]|uniref:FAD dependent oxidoreductase TIGR03364 n=1 Tax=Actinokineospora alba TaxID=504798 RepID=A0A1H0W2A1_9PSEU|nr:TIGR03364 family FAD-dependent oxidoreductase [Actinokineospora alba]TDP67777.1 FAD dependent oxidoreductase TIGR03364 [Actinokineospora alba]SDI71668.1 FAD dependent oxidoreductase TIGR03364 [Actinokineospora alba]SDP84655.1 FAD dependent oxidoreductase TIGR03364 [Actinokineospora alba]